MKTYKFILSLLFTTISFAISAQKLDTLRNFNAYIELVAPKYSGVNQWGYFVGHSSVYRQQFAEKYYINGTQKIKGVIVHLSGKYRNASNAVEFNVYSVGENKLPSNRLETKVVFYKNLDLSGKPYYVPFSKEVTVSDSFFVSFNIDDYLHGGFDGDTLALICATNGTRSADDLKLFGRNAVQVHNHDEEEWKDFYYQNFTPFATHFAIFPVVISNEIQSIDDYHYSNKIEQSFYNPTEQSLEINFSHNITSNFTLSISDLTGKLVHEKSFDWGINSFKFNNLLLNKGIYILHYSSKNQIFSSKILIK